MNAQDVADIGLFCVRESLIKGAGAGVFLAADVAFPSNFLVSGDQNNIIPRDCRIDTFIEYDGDRMVDDDHDASSESHKYFFSLPKSNLAINGATSRGIAPIINHDPVEPNCFSRWERV